MLSFYQKLVIRPLVRSIFGALGMVVSEDRINSFIGNLGHFTEAPIYPKRFDLLRAWMILSQMTVDVGMSGVKVQAVLNSLYGINAPNDEADELADMVEHGDQSAFVAQVANLLESEAA